jgi:uncharacterized protein involved in exopolysaccharide biosynthesis
MHPARGFATVFLGVFLFIFLGGALITYLMPATYVANARLHAPDPKVARRMASTAFLEEVGNRLDLPRTMADRYGQTEPLEPRRVELLLRRSVRVIPNPQTGSIEIRASSHSPEEAAQWANAVAAAAQADEANVNAVKILEAALPPAQPARPNKGLNLAITALVGIFLGTMAGGVGAKLAVGFTAE